MTSSNLRISLLLIIVLNIGYASGVTLSPVFQPAYYVIIILSILLMTKYALQHKDSHFLLSCICFMIVVLITTLQYIFLNIEAVRALVRFSLPFLTFALSILIYSRVPMDKRPILRNWFFLALLILLTVDALWRVSMNLSSITGMISSRYVFKSGGLIFYDSNFNAVFAGLCYLVTKNKSPKLFSNGFLILSLISFSLAVYGGLLINFLARPLARRLSIPAFNTGLIISLICTLSLISMLSGYDGSFDTKLKMISDFIGYYESIHLEKLLGIGFGNYQEIMSSRHSAHNILTQFVEGGYLYLVTMCIFYYHLMITKPNYYEAAPYLIVIFVFAIHPVIYSSLIFFILYINSQTYHYKKSVIRSF